ncbi:MAG: hypothetical protein AAF191_08560, partial [Verrucomicrobiota bacterium]
KNEWNALLESASRDIYREIRPWVDEAFDWIETVEKEHSDSSLQFIIGEFDPTWEPLLSAQYKYLGVTNGNDRVRMAKKVIIEKVIDAREKNEVSIPHRERIASQAAAESIKDLFDWQHAGHATFHLESGVALSSNVGMSYFQRRSSLVKLGLVATLIGIICEACALSVSLMLK